MDPGTGTNVSESDQCDRTRLDGKLLKQSILEQLGWIWNWKLAVAEILEDSDRGSMWLDLELDSLAGSGTN